MWDSGWGLVILIVMFLTWLSVANEKSVKEANAGVLGCLLIGAFAYYVLIDVLMVVLCVVLG